jgi:hypothetical protein
MKIIATFLFCLIAAAVSLSCGAAKGQLDCNWLATNNCWKTTFAAATSCLPNSNEIGTLSADGLTCTYASGAVVTFDNPVVLPVPNGTQWKFTISNAGQQCFRFEQPTDKSSKLTTSAGTVTQSSSGLTFDISCPNGSAYEAGNGLQLLSCPNGLTGMPGVIWSDTSMSLSFGVLGTGSAQGQVFSCRK